MRVVQAIKERLEFCVDTRCSLLVSLTLVDLSILTLPINQCTETIKREELEVVQLKGNLWANLHFRLLPTLFNFENDSRSQFEP